jgi:uncharacterized membrane protein
MWETTTAGQTVLDISADEGRSLVGTFSRYGEAQDAVDRLAAGSFPVEQSEIVGRDLVLVERVTGRMDWARAIMAGAGTGAWFGLFIGLLVGLFTTGPVWLGLLLGGLLIGAAWGGLFGILAYWYAGGRHRFASTRALAAQRYEVLVTDGYAEQARRLLAPPRAV